MKAMQIVLEDLDAEVVRIVREKAKADKISLELALNRLINLGYAKLQSEEQAKSK